MSRKPAPILTDHELRLMNVLWERGAATVAEVVQALREPRLAYNTVLSTLRTLERKRYLGHQCAGRAFVFRFGPLIGKETAADAAVAHVLDRFFERCAARLIIALLKTSEIDDADVLSIERLIVPGQRGRKLRRSARRGAKNCSA